jgi:hypothetical protein
VPKSKPDKMPRYDAKNINRIMPLHNPIVLFVMSFFLPVLTH